jgi:hypothetical protein
VDRARIGALIGGGFVIREPMLGTYVDSDGQNSEIMERDTKSVLIRQ